MLRFRGCFECTTGAECLKPSIALALRSTSQAPCGVSGPYCWQSCLHPPANWWVWTADEPSYCLHALQTFPHVFSRPFPNWPRATPQRNASSEDQLQPSERCRQWQAGITPLKHGLDSSPIEIKVDSVTENTGFVFIYPSWGSSPLFPIRFDGELIQSLASVFCPLTDAYGMTCAVTCCLTLPFTLWKNAMYSQAH